MKYHMKPVSATQVIVSESRVISFPRKIPSIRRDLQSDLINDMDHMRISGSEPSSLKRTKAKQEKSSLKS